MRLPEFVQLYRGKGTDDPRPYKALEIQDHLPGWSQYRYRKEWAAIV
ncbi:hypothetical protein GQ600_640 [Phytophthora cactorum]|nr:hypothetical protein GQ600_640 [Phytophthora cactorum]